MALFDDNDLQGFSDLVEDLAFKDDCEILEDSAGTPDGGGGRIGIAQNVVDTVKCALIDAGFQPTERLANQKLDGKVQQTVLLPRGTDVKKSHQLRIKGKTYHIIDVKDPTTYEVARFVSVWREDK
jgi:hypothetical protein